MPGSYSHHTLASPVLSRRALISLLIPDMKQNPEAAGTVLPIELRTIGVGKSMAHFSAGSLGPVTK
jgi:hypothetical protein